MSRTLFTTTVMLSALLIAACSESPEVPRAAVDRGVPVIAEPLRFERARTRAEADRLARELEDAAADTP